METRNAMKTSELNLTQVQFQICLKHIFVNDVIHVCKNFYSKEYYTCEKIRNIKSIIKSIFPEVKDVGISFPEELNTSSTYDNCKLLILGGNETYPYFYANHIALLKIEANQVYMSEMLQINETVFKNAKTSSSEKDKATEEIENYVVCSQYIKKIFQLMFYTPKTIPFICRQKGSDSIF